MILRSAVSVLAAVAALTACSSSSSGGSPSVANTAPGGGGGSTAAVASGGGSSGDFCSRLVAASTNLGNLANVGTNPDYSKLKSSFQQQVSAFQALDNGAPAEVKPAIEDIISGLQTAESAVSDPSNPDVSKLSALATKLPGDVTKLSTYLAANCH